MLKRNQKQSKQLNCICSQCGSDKNWCCFDFLFAFFRTTLRVQLQIFSYDFLLDYFSFFSNVFWILVPWSPVYGYDRPSVPRYNLEIWNNNMIYKFYFSPPSFISTDVNFDAIIDLLPILTLVVQNCKFLQNGKMSNYEQFTFLIEQTFL